MAYTKYENEFKTKIVKLYDNGCSAGKVSEEFGIPQTNIYDWSKSLRIVLHLSTQIIYLMNKRK